MDVTVPGKYALRLSRWFISIIILIF
jgi:hypothetical protein